MADHGYSFELEIRMPPILEALEIARGLTHATFTAAKGAALVAALEQALDVGCIAVDEHHLNPAVASDELDEDPVQEGNLQTEAEQSAFKRGWAAGQQDTLESLSGPAPAAPAIADVEVTIGSTRFSEVAPVSISTPDARKGAGKPSK